MVPAEVQIEHPGDLPGLHSSAVLELSMYSQQDCCFFGIIFRITCILLAFSCTIPAIRKPNRAFCIKGFEG